MNETQVKIKTLSISLTDRKGLGHYGEFQWMKLAMPTSFASNKLPQRRYTLSNQSFICPWFIESPTNSKLHKTSFSLLKKSSNFLQKMMKCHPNNPDLNLIIKHVYCLNLFKTISIKFFSNSHFTSNLISFEKSRLPEKLSSLLIVKTRMK